MIKKPVNENGIAADMFHDGSGKSHKALVMMGGSEGGRNFSGRMLAKRMRQMVDLGYTVLSLAYFKEPGLPPTLEEVPLEYFEKAFTWLAQQPEVASDELALLGVSMGAEASLILGSMHPYVKSVIALSPSSVVWQGIPKMGADKNYVPKSAWTYHGAALTYVPDGHTTYNFGTLIRTALYAELRKMYEKALHTRPEVEAATIPVENIQGAILLMSGKRDQMWPASEMSEQMLSRLAASGFAYPYQHVAYDSNHSGYIMKDECWEVIAGFLKQNFPPL